MSGLCSSIVLVFELIAGKNSFDNDWKIKDF